MRVLVVEDDESLGRELTKLATRMGIAVDNVGTRREALGFIEQRAYELALVDRRLPDGDGALLAPAMRAIQPRLQIILLTALGSTQEKIEGLNFGADDYLTKPYDPDELVARMRACLRRRDGVAEPNIILGNLHFSPQTRLVQVAGNIVVLHRRELALLSSLLTRSGRVVLRETIAEEVFGRDEAMNWHTLTALVSQLRLRLKEAGAEVDIHTSRGVGCYIRGQRATAQ